MSDTIYREDAIKHLKRWFHNKGWMVSDEDCTWKEADDRKTEPTGYNLSPVEDEQTERGE